MTNLKDKLSASVRQAKAGQAPAAAKPAPNKPVPQKPVARGIAPEPGTGKVESKPKAARPSGRGAGEQASVGAGVPDSGNALFPDRVWPD